MNTSRVSDSWDDFYESDEGLFWQKPCPPTPTSTTALRESAADPCTSDSPTLPLLSSPSSVWNPYIEPCRNLPDRNTHLWSGNHATSRGAQTYTPAITAVSPRPQQIQQWPAQPSLQSLDNLDFLTLIPGDAALSISLPSGGISTINGLIVEVIAEKCPLLAYSFESGESGSPRASVEAPSRVLIICLLRFIYVGDYLDGVDGCSILVHAQLCRMAELFEIPELQVMAHANVIRETEVSCSKPTPPADLCEAIRFIFDHLADQTPLVDTILHYCVHCFLYHQLNTNDEFQKLTFEMRKFTQELCRTNFQRGFEDDGAIDIVRLQTEEATPFTRAEQTRMALGDFLYDFHGLDSYSDVDCNTHTRRDRNSTAECVFVHRPKHRGIYTSSDESDEETTPFDFTLVRRPKANAHWVKAINELDSSSSGLEMENNDERMSRVGHICHQVEAEVYEADHSMSESDSDYDEARASGAAKIGSLYVRNKEADEGDLTASFATIKPQHEANRGGSAPSHNDEKSDSDWSLL
ncbi:hypothetical protein EJ05DRAFT_254516 [Pseudovirgaria hyperparasitica]|uniref:BTB domain-containing protein n=1 Tax=Pseudovirgaria hyperparasitica TaxID=470096 RepID=A0A6A6WEA9_9PEZI|nr:uncharacterized protein EJ05DRAFT_254516 [Pseudovirgaria hyperparasitica]KAF2761158.1 hypothetical protein EJ05DRAFT_254516 [Pseudovirgaria hyperparasitica]